MNCPIEWASLFDCWYRYSLFGLSKFCRESTQRRLEFAVNTVPDMVLLPVKLSRRWKSPNMPDITAPSAERLRKFSVWFYDLLKTFWPSMVSFSVKRQAVGIWKCLRCRKVLAGGAYVLRYTLLTIDFLVTMVLIISSFPLAPLPLSLPKLPSPD